MTEEEQVIFDMEFNLADFFLIYEEVTWLQPHSLMFDGMTIIVSMG